MHFSHWAINLMMWTGNNVRKEEWHVALHCWLAPAAGSTLMCGSILKRGESCGGARIAMSVPCKLDLLSQVLTSFAVTNHCWWSCQPLCSNSQKKNPSWFFFFSYPSPHRTCSQVSSLHTHMMLPSFKERFQEWGSSCMILKSFFNVFQHFTTSQPDQNHFNIFSEPPLHYELLLCLRGNISFLWFKPKENQQQQH